MYAAQAAFNGSALSRHFSGSEEEFGYELHPLQMIDYFLYYQRSNVFLCDGESTVKLGDFGISRVLGSLIEQLALLAWYT